MTSAINSAKREPQKTNWDAAASEISALQKGVVAIENITAAGALSVSTPISRLNTSSGSDVAITLAAGTEGQDKFVYIETKGGAGNFVLTPATFANGTTITFNSVGDTVHLKYINAKWVVVSNNGAAVA